MPNTLAHVGVQIPITRAGIQEADPKWILLGCVIPDVPWILQRVVYFTEWGDPFVLRSYIVVQASLLVSLILCAALALLAKHAVKVFGILSLNVVLHLLLDACQTKWANGVHFLAPFSWNLTNWGFFWPESLVTHLLTALGVLCIIWYGRLGLMRESGLKRPNLARIAGIVLLVAAYFTLPLLLLQGPRAADNHYLATLSLSQGRAGRYVEFDRAQYIDTREGKFLSYYGGTRRVRVEPIELQPPATVSVRGFFVTENKVQVSDYHAHPEGLRDYASYLGLGLVVTIWIGVWVRDTLSPFDQDEV